MGGRRPGDVWSNFQYDTTKNKAQLEKASCKRCPEEIMNPKPHKLRCHILQECVSWTSSERDQWVRISQDKENLKSRSSSVDSVSTTESDENSLPSQEDFSRAVADFVYCTGSAFRIVDHPTFKRLALLGCAGLTVPSRQLVGERLLEGEPMAISDENDASSSSSDDEEDSDGDRDGDTEGNADNYVDMNYDYPHSQE